MAWRAIYATPFPCINHVSIVRQQTDRLCTFPSFSRHITPLNRRACRSKASINTMAAAQVASHPIETVEESGSKKVRPFYSFKDAIYLVRERLRDC